MDVREKSTIDECCNEEKDVAGVRKLQQSKRKTFMMVYIAYDKKYDKKRERAFVCGRS